MKKNISPLRLFLFSLLIIFIAEAAIMIVLSFFPPLSFWASSLIDASILLLLVFPALHILLYRPYLKFIREKESITQEIQGRHETLLRASPDCIKLFDPDGSLIFANHEGLHGKCQSENSSKGCDYESSLVPEDCKKYRKAIEDALSGKTTIVEVRHIPSFPRQVCMEVMAPVKDDKGRVTGIFGISRDMSGYKKLEKAKEALSQMIVHDLNNPLWAAMGNLQILKMELTDSLTQEQAEILRNAWAGLDAIKHMVDNLLDISMMEDNRLILKKKSVDLYALAEKIKGLMQYLAHEGGKSIDLKLSPNLPPLNADEEILARIISNLIRNAIKFSSPNTSIEVGVAYKVDKKELLFSVKDHGEGIPQEYLGRIFDKYVRVDDAKTMAVSGKGIGLTFCKMAVESHGGRIWVESALNEGSVFYFTIPLT